MPTLQEHERFMRIALDLAREAAQAGEIPVGALVVRNGEILSQARNEREERSDISAHAEILALRRAGEKLGHWEKKKARKCCSGQKRSISDLQKK